MRYKIAPCETFSSVGQFGDQITGINHLSKKYSLFMKKKSDDLRSSSFPIVNAA